MPRRRRLKGERNAILLVCAFLIAAATSCLMMNVTANHVDDGVEIDGNTGFDYYIHVRYDGVDASGKESSDSQRARLFSDRIDVVDKIPSDLQFVTFTSPNNSYTATARNDDRATCSGKIVQDKESSGWNAEHTYFAVQGLVYDEKTRSVSFAVDELQAGCQITVGVRVEPKRDNYNYTASQARRDYYGTSYASSLGFPSILSNTTHAYVGNEIVPLYKVSYEYSGATPDELPDLPETTHYSWGAAVDVAPAPVVEGYTFSGWQSKSVTPVDGSFQMPSMDIAFTGVFVKNTKAAEHTITYQIVGDQPEGYVLPATKTYAAGEVVSVDAHTADFNSSQYHFTGWAMDGKATDGGFKMPDKDIVLTGTFDRLATSANANSTDDQKESAQPVITQTIILWSAVAVVAIVLVVMFIKLRKHKFLRVLIPAITAPAILVFAGCLTLRNLQTIASFAEKSEYRLSYETNAPSGCKEQLYAPEAQNYEAGKTVNIESGELYCAGYKFLGWHTDDEKVAYINDDYITMPSRDLVFRAEWGKVSLARELKSNK